MTKNQKKKKQNNLDSLANYRRVRAAAIAYLGGKCVRCGFSDPRALQFDHINGGGFKTDHHRRGGNLARQIVTGKRPDIQLLCANCNWIKRAENGETGGYGRRF